MSAAGPFHGQGRLGQGRGSRQGAANAAQQHLGDRLSAFVDGELGGDMRDRVLAHLAGCEACKAEAEAQRRLKEVVAGAMPPALSAGLLARLQGLPASDPNDPNGPGDRNSPLDPPPPGGGPGIAIFGPLDAFDGLRVGLDEGFRIHHVRDHRGGRDAERVGRDPHGSARPSGSRGRWFAFAAAGAVSMAALTLGGALPLDATVEGGGGVDGPSTVTPVSGNAGTGPVESVAHTVARRRDAAGSSGPDGSGLSGGTDGGATPMSASRALLAPPGVHAVVPPLVPPTPAPPPGVRPVARASASASPQAARGRLPG